MTATLANSIERSLQALCETIAADPGVLTAREQAEAFLADEDAVSLYRDVMNLGRSLEQRHRSGETITTDEVGAFEVMQEKADANSLIRAFADAQETLQTVATTVNAYVTKTLEKGRVPAAAEMSSGGCGEGCGCH